MISQLYGQMQQLIQSLIKYCVSLGMNNERKTSNSYYRNLSLMLIYYIQLSGYIYSTDEQKELVNPESIYLAEWIEDATVGYFIMKFEVDWLTLTLFYFVIVLIELLYFILILQLLSKNKSQNFISKKYTQIFFQYFQWILILPFQEAMTAAISCGDDALLVEYADYTKEECLTRQNQIHLTFSLIGTIQLAGIIILQPYCFRNYEFLQVHLHKKYAFYSPLILFLQQFLVIVNIYGAFDTNILNHVLFVLIVFFNIISSIQDLLFGLSKETQLFVTVSTASLAFEINVAIWRLNENNHDKEIVFSTLLLFPLFISIAETLYEQFYQWSFKQLCKNGVFNCESLEQLLLMSTKQLSNQQDIFNFTKFIKLHEQNCKDINCLCHNNIQNINIERFIIYQFQRQIIQIQKQKYLINLEDITCKFCSFLEKYQENSIFSYKYLTEIIFTCDQMKQKNGMQTGFFFQNLTKCLLEKNSIIILQNQNNSSTLPILEYIIISDIRLYLEYETVIQNQLIQQIIYIKRFWESYKDNIIITSEQFIQYIDEIERKRQNLLKLQKQFMSKRVEQQDNIFTLRLKFIILLSCQQNFLQEFKISYQLSMAEQDLLRDEKDHIFTSLSFINGQSISIIVNVSQNQIGQIVSKNNEQYNIFFGQDIDEQKFQYINQLMPMNFGAIHDQLIQNYFIQGYTKLINSHNEIFILTLNEIIEKVYLCIGSFFPQIKNDWQFFMVAHLRKMNSIDISTKQSKGLILLDEKLQIVGITNIIQKFLYYELFKNKEDESQIFENSENYQGIRIDNLIPNILIDFQEYLKIKELKQENDFNRTDYICNKQRSFLQSYKRQELQRMKQNFNKYENQSQNTLTSLSKLIYQQIDEIDEIDSIQQYRVISQIPIEYSIQQYCLPLQSIENIQSNFIYYVVEIELLQEINQYQQQITTVGRNYEIRKSTLTTLHFYDEIKQQQSQKYIQNQDKIEKLNIGQNILSNDEHQQDEIEFIVEKTQSISKNSQSDVMVTLQNIQEHIIQKNQPIRFYSYYLTFIVLLLTIIVQIILCCIVFTIKNNIQSECSDIVNYEIDYFDYYSQVACGSRNLIYYRDFKSNLNNTLININNSILSITHEDQIYTSWLLIKTGLTKLTTLLNETQLTIIKQQSLSQQSVYFIHPNLQNKITQILEDKASYFYFMLSFFYNSLNSFVSTPDLYLTGQIDTYEMWLQRSIINFNFFSMAQNGQESLNDCINQVDNINTSFDNTSEAIFYLLYGITLLMVLIQIILMFSIKHLIFIYINLFQYCASDESTFIIHHQKQLLNLITQHQVIFQLHEFKEMSKQQHCQLLTARTTQSFVTSNQNTSQPILKKINKGKKKRNTLNLAKQGQIKNKFGLTYPLILILIQTILICSYVLTFQLTYQNMSQDISPLMQSSLHAQELRLNMIIILHRWNLNLFRLYYSQLDIDEQKLNNYNAYADAQILSLVDGNISQLYNDMQFLIQNSFSSLVQQSQGILSLDPQIRDILLNHDVCLIVGCQSSLLLTNKLYSDQLVSFFQDGLVSMYDKISKVIISGSQSLQQLITNDSIINEIDEIINDSNYFLYYVWGYDLFCYQIQQLSQIFISALKIKLSDLKSFNEFYVILFGLILFCFVFYLQIKIIQHQMKSYNLVKESLTLIPIGIMIEKNLIKHFQYINKKYYY